MKILLIHNRYLERGGEDEVVNAERALLSERGHDVILYQRSNEEILDYKFIQKMRFLVNDVYDSRKTYSEVRGLIQTEKPAIAHIHNTFYVISPSVYQACQDEGLPMVQTLHNYRYLCPIGTFYRNGHICEDCQEIGKGACVQNRCWRGSFLYSWTLKRVVDRMEKGKILSHKVNREIVFTQFGKNKHIQGGLKEDRLVVKPHFTDIEKKERSDVGRYAIFVGRLADYKGVKVLIEAYKKCGHHLRIIGDGPLSGWVQRQAETMKNVDLLGRLPYDRTVEEIRKAAFLIFSSTCYETFGKVIIDAFACSVPVLASDAGVAREIVSEGQNGRLFHSGNSDDLATKIDEMLADPELIKRMGEKARADYEEKYSKDKNYDQLMAIYQEVLGER